MSNIFEEKQESIKWEYYAKGLMTAGILIGIWSIAITLLEKLVK